MGYGQNDLLIRRFDASCSSVCDGSVDILNFRLSPDRYYFWRSTEERRYHLLDDASVTDLCAGTYDLRQVDVHYEEVVMESELEIEKDEFELISQFSFSSENKRELTLYLDLDRNVPYLNYHTKAEYSIDGGQSWKPSSQLNRKVTTSITSLETNHYLLVLPTATSNVAMVMVRIYGRKIDLEKEPSKKQLCITSSYLESKEITNLKIEIAEESEVSMNIKSTVSNEIDGNDGYIVLDIVGGLSPYTITWENGSISLIRNGLTAGTYWVYVEDRKKCRLKSEFNILAPSNEQNGQDFRLTPTMTSGIFRLEIDGLHRRPMELVISRASRVDIKRFRINPLYDDLNMELDLSFIAKGTYTATLSTSGYSKKIEFSID